MIARRAVILPAWPHLYDLPPTSWTCNGGVMYHVVVWGMERSRLAKTKPLPAGGTLLSRPIQVRRVDASPDRELPWVREPDRCPSSLGFQG